MPTLGRLRYEHDTVRSQADQRAAGRAARGDLPRSAHATYDPQPDRDPLAIIAAQNADRLPDLVPLRMSRMAADPFAFYRGTAALQAADLAGAPDTNHYVIASGDAHLSNFGVYASPTRSLVFDLNDFDEASAAPWEVRDLKRLVTSVIIAARTNEYDDATVRAAALHAGRAYRRSLDRALGLTAIERYYLRVDVGVIPGLAPESAQVIRRTIKRAQRRTSEHVVAKIMERGPDGEHWIREDPPRLTHMTDRSETRVGSLLAAYRRSTSPDIALLLQQYTVTDVARRVVGVGSVGTRCSIAVLTGPRGEALVLQMKEASDSVLAEYGRVHERPDPPREDARTHTHPGYRVVAYQRILQATSDPFLGYLNDGGRGYYVRQFRDQNVSFETDELEPAAFLDYVAACAALLARAHSQSPEAAFISGYLGSGDVFDIAVADWAEAYADQSLADYRAFRSAIDAGRFTTS